MDVQNAKEKLSKALTDIKANFKPDDGAVGGQKIQSMFVNLWKSGVTGKVTLITSSLIVLLLLSSCLGGSSSSDESAGKRLDTLVMKGVYMRMPGDAALEACQKMVSSSKDLAVVDFRKGIEWDKDGVAKAAAVKQYEEYVEEARRRSFFEQKHREHQEKREELSNRLSQQEIERQGYGMLTYDECVERYSKEYRSELADAKDVKRRLESDKHYPPDEKLRIMPKNLIRIAVREDVVNEDEWKSACDVWFGEEGKVKTVIFSREGIARLFNSGELSADEFAQALVDNYSGIPSLDEEEQTKPMENSGLTWTNVWRTWTHKDPRGYRVQLYEMSIVDSRGRRVQKMTLSIFATKPESARKFD